METTGKMKKKKKKEVTLPPTHFFHPYTPRSNDFYSGMPSTEPLPLIFEPRQISDYAKEGAIFQRFFDELSAASDDLSVEADIFQRLYDELFAASGNGSVVFKNTSRLQFGSAPTLSEIPPVLKEVALDTACYGGYKFPYGNLGEASAADAPDPSGQVGISNGYPKSNDSSVVPVREVAALKIDEKCSHVLDNLQSPAHAGR